MDKCKKITKEEQKQFQAAVHVIQMDGICPHHEMALLKARRKTDGKYVPVIVAVEFKTNEDTGEKEVQMTPIAELVMNPLDYVDPTSEEDKEEVFYIPNPN